MNHPPRCIRFRSKSSYTVAPTRQDDDCVVRSARESWAADFCAVHPQPVHAALFLVRSGSGCFTTPRASWRLEAGSLAVHRSGAARAFWCDGDAPLDVHIIDLIGPGWSQAFVRWLGLADGVVRLAQPHRMQDTLDQIHQIVRQGLPGAAVQAGHLVHAGLIAAHDVITTADASLHTWRAARRLIAEGRCGSVQALAHQLGVSTGYLARVFRRHDHHGVGAQVRRARLAHCLEDLRSGTPLAVLADRLGYADASSFGKAFRRAMGTSPGGFRGL
jgi:AraC-like DNA-binding protein